MKSFIKKYKYILIFLVSVLVISYICYKNYSNFENFVTCSSSITNAIVLNSDSSFRKNSVESTTGGNIVDYYTLDLSGDNNNLDCFSSIRTEPTTNDFLRSVDISNIDTTDISLNELLNQCVNFANTADFFTVDNTGKCSSYNLNSVGNLDKTNYNNQIFITPGSDISNIQGLKNVNNCNIDSAIDGNNINSFGYGGFTSLGKSNMVNSGFSSMIKRYDPACVSQINIKNTLDRIVNECKGIDCDGELARLKVFQGELNSLYDNGGYYIADPTRDCTGKDCVEASFESEGSLLYNSYATYSNNTIDSSLVEDTKKTLNDYKQEMAIEKESSLNTKSTFMQYMILLVVFIICVIMIILNITNPDIITAEILTGFILFIILIIFVTSKFFNVDYGIFNKIFSLHLGNAGSRNIFVNPGIDTNL